MNPFINIINDSFIRELNVDNQFDRFGNPSESDKEDNLADYQHASEHGFGNRPVHAGGASIQLFHMGNDKVEVYATVHNELVGGTQSVVRGYVKKFPQVYYTYVYKDYQGNGIGYKMHELILNYSGGIISDSTLTNGSLATMMKLGSNHNICLYTSQKKLVPFDQNLLKQDKGSLIVVSLKPLI
jgi:GNAT superfamily N-acetyltransferase